MRIAFDLDGTIVPTNGSGVARLPPPLGWFFPERLRAGTLDLMRSLRADGHEIWVYTTSLRSPRYIRIWFRISGVRLSGVINAERHRDRLASLGGVAGASKYPPAFGIDLLVDDCAGVEEEGRRHGFAVVRVDADDREWVDRVLVAVEDVGRA